MQKVVVGPGGAGPRPYRRASPGRPAPVHLVLDDLPWARGTVEARDRHAGRHRLLHHQRQTLRARGQTERRPGPSPWACRSSHRVAPTVVRVQLPDPAPQLDALRSVAEDPQPPLGDLFGDVAEGGDQLAELLLRDQPPAATISGLLESGPRREPDRQRVRHTHGLGCGSAKILTQPSPPWRGSAPPPRLPAVRRTAGASRPEVRSRRRGAPGARSPRTRERAARRTPTGPHHRRRTSAPSAAAGVCLASGEGRTRPARRVSTRMERRILELGRESGVHGNGSDGCRAAPWSGIHEVVDGDPRVDLIARPTGRCRSR